MEPIITLTTEDLGHPTLCTHYSTLFKAMFSVALLFQTSSAIEPCLTPQLIFTAHHREQASVCGHQGFATTGNGKCKQITNIWLALSPPLALISQVFLKYLRNLRLKHAGYFGPYSGLHELSSSEVVVPALGNRKPVLSLTHMRWRSTR